MYKSPAHKAAEAVVRSMGVTCVNISMRQFIYALELLHQEPDMIHSITTKLHPALLAFYPDSTTDAMERNLRWARDSILKRGGSGTAAAGGGVHPADYAQRRGSAGCHQLLHGERSFVA